MTPDPGTFYPVEAYGAGNPNAGRPANGDVDAWGGYQWPGGVPSALLGAAVYTSSSSGQTARLSVRVELVDLWVLLLQIADRVHHYAIWTDVDGQSWGPWAYDNRPVSGTSTPSGHSAALSVDINAPWNPYSWTWQSNMPPGLVADLEACGMYWGGRYVDQKTDPMHYGYCYPPGAVAGHVDVARRILAGAGNGSSTDDSGGFLMALTDDEQQELLDAVRAIKGDLIPSGRGQGQATVGGTIAATLTQTQRNYNAIVGDTRTVDDPGE